MKDEDFELPDDEEPILSDELENVPSRPKNVHRNQDWVVSADKTEVLMICPCCGRDNPIEDCTTVDMGFGKKKFYCNEKCVTVDGIRR